MTKKKIVKEEKKYNVDYFIDHMIEKWKKNGTVVDEEETRIALLSMCILLPEYRFECLLKTLIEVQEEMEIFDWDKYSE